MKKRMTALLVICLLIATALLPAGAEGLSGTIRFSTWGYVAEKEINEAIIAAFMEENPGATVELEYIPEQYVQKIDTMFLGGDAPDVIYGHPHYFSNWAKNGLLMNLDDMFEQDKDFFFGEDFETSMYDMFMYNGNHVGTVNGHDTFLLFYNKTMFDNAGVGYPTEEWTWDDLVEAAKKLTIDTADKKQYGIMFNEITPVLFSFGGDYYDNMDNPEKVVANSPDSLAAYQFIQDCIQVHKVAPDTRKADVLGGSFATGMCAMEMTGAWGVASYAQIEDFEWDVAMVPLREGYPRRTSAYVAGYAVNASTKNPELAKAFAKYFQSDTGQTLLASMGLITVINKRIASSDESLKSPGSPEHAAYRVTTMEHATNGYASLTNLEETRQKVIFPATDQLVDGTATAEEVAQMLQEGLEGLLPEGK